MSQVEDDKFGTRSDKCKLVGYPKECLGYHFYNPTKTKGVCGNTLPSWLKEFILEGVSGSNIDLEEVQEP